MITTQELSQMELFKGLSEDQLGEIAKACETLNFRAGDIVVHEGDEADRVLVLLEGEVEIFVQLSSSPERIPLSIIKNPYQTFGWSALVPPNYYTASSLCKKDTRIVAIKRDALMQVLENNPEIGMTVYQRIAKVVSERLRNCRGILIKSL